MTDLRKDYPDPTRNLEMDSPESNLTAMRPGDGAGIPSVFACPTCSGVLWEMQDGKLLRFRCRVGHAFTARALLEEFQPRVEDLLWAAARGLYEKASLQERLTEMAIGDEQVGLRQSAAKGRLIASKVKQLLEDGID